MKNELDLHIKAYQGDNLYDFDNEIILKWYPHRVIKFSEDSTSMLELGLGHGFTADIFSKHFKRYIILDGSSAVIQNFKNNYPDCNAEIVETYFEEFDTEERFDVINLGFILEHIDNPFQILTRFKKFLAPGGKVFVSVPNAEVLNRRLGNLAGLLPDMTVLSENDLLLGHKRYYTVETLTKEIENAGYTVERMEGIYLKPFTTKQILSLNFDKKIIDALCEAAIDYPELSCGMLAQIK
jgi:2-polyprenyl-3-methyl-5-hydroxy-6-metoxy-1,4-benzoquinol methylase